MIDLHDALDILRKTEIKRITEETDLHQCLNRILAEDIYSDVDMPPFNKSAMDGYACRKEDLHAPLKVKGTIHAGGSHDFQITPGTCVKIMTGAPVPAGADTVIMVEHTENIDENLIRFTQRETKANISIKGEDVCSGDLLLKTGTWVRPHHLASLASAGAYSFKVYRHPVIPDPFIGGPLF